MDSGFYSAFTGLAARMQSLDLLANNLANVNTAGYKSEKEFYRSYTASLHNQGLSQVNQAINDYGLMGGARVDLTAGALQTTGNDTDLALDGSGFFVVNTKAGLRYTRNGTFQLNTQRQLVDGEGNLVQGPQGPIQVPSGKLNISADGTLSVDGAVLTQLKLVDFAPGTQLSPEGSSNFAVPANAQTIPVSGQVRQGMLEASNSDPVTGAVALISIQRNAEMMQRALSIFNTDFNQTAVQELPHV
ncbi:MAG TPA: flagellar basal-body rod protein FlgF [Candidatus Acidoferrales bacterium]|jgi:flagellar basal-body rod protein FlgF/flagellar basal-body rod protein FlgG|nr:flagellar basal-body rod protein FlgF [Candidatus Acidoferrales bacterium]